MFYFQYIPAGEDRTFDIAGQHRLARIVQPTISTDHPPVVFCFHGGGGRAYYAVDEYAIQKNWPEAIVYYCQGSVGKGGFTTWSASDLGYFDALRSDAICRLHANPKAVFAMGYSTGANFCADLWRSRPDRIAAFVFVSGGGYEKGLPKRPVFLSYGQEEPDAKRLKALGIRLGAMAIVHPRAGGHTYPQGQNVEIADFMKSVAARIAPAAQSSPAGGHPSASPSGSSRRG